jgi:hypothetical protein
MSASSFVTGSPYSSKRNAPEQRHPSCDVPLTEQPLSLANQIIAAAIAICPSKPIDFAIAPYRMTKSR